jgi:putative DNA primase/helicase
VTIPEAQRDKALPSKLREELSGILSWAVEGCLTWQREGLGLPEEVKDATEAYRAEMDVLADFLAECCLIKPYARVASSTLYAAYVRWCEGNSEHAFSRTAFALRLQERGFMNRRSEANGGVTWHRLGLQEPHGAF